MSWVRETPSLKATDDEVTLLWTDLWWNRRFLCFVFRVIRTQLDVYYMVYYMHEQQHVQQYLHVQPSSKYIFYISRNILFFCLEGFSCSLFRDHALEFRKMSYIVRTSGWLPSDLSNDSSKSKSVAAPKAKRLGGEREADSSTAAVQQSYSYIRSPDKQWGVP